MNLDKKIKEQLHNYKIQPSAKPWDRIEAELNAKHKPKPWIVYVRWAAAASVLVVLFSYPYWRISNNSQDLTSVTPKIERNIDSTSKLEIKNQNTEVVNLTPEKAKENSEFKKSNFNNTNTEQTIRYKSNFNGMANSNQVTNSNNLTNLTEKKQVSRPLEQEIAFLNYNMQTFDIQHNNPNQLNLPEFSNELTETASNYIKWKKFFMEDMNEESDSTLTERALNLANKKSVAFVKNNWKPAVAKWVKLKKGF